MFGPPEETEQRAVFKAPTGMRALKKDGVYGTVNTYDTHGGVPTASVNPAIQAEFEKTYRGGEQTEGVVSKYNKLLDQVLSPEFAKKGLYNKQAITSALSGASHAFGVEAGMPIEREKIAETAKAREAQVDLGYEQADIASEDRRLQREQMVQNQAENIGLRRAAETRATAEDEWRRSPKNPQNILSSAQAKAVGEKAESPLFKAQVDRLTASGAPITPESMEMLNKGFVYKAPIAEKRGFYNPKRIYGAGEYAITPGGWQDPSTGKLVQPKVAPAAQPKQGLRKIIKGTGGSEGEI